jgi:hypothetical protein
VIQKRYVPGTTYPIYVDGTGPNNGALRLPAWDERSSTCTTSGADQLYHDEIAGGIVITCPIKLNDVIATKPGQNSGKTTQGVTDRCGRSLQSVSSIVSFTASGSPTLLQPESCQLVLLPVVVDATNGEPTWPALGRDPVRVVGFSWWVIQSVVSPGKEVDAVYVGDAPTTGVGGALPSAYIAQLTG